MFLHKKYDEHIRKKKKNEFNTEDYNFMWKRSINKNE